MGYGSNNTASAPFGLKPSRYLNGAPWTGQANVYYITAPATIVGIGDPVASSGTGDAFGTPAVTSYVAGSPLRGVVIGFLEGTPGHLGTSLVPPAGTFGLAGQGYCDKSGGTGITSGYVLVADDPNIIFEVQANAALAVTAIGFNADLIAAADANTTTGLSVAALASSTSANTATLNLKVLGFVQRPDNTIGDAYDVWEVLINNHELRTGIAGI